MSDSPILSGRRKTLITMIEDVLKPKNLYKAHRQVVRNKGAAGVDGMKVKALPCFIKSNRKHIIHSIINFKYVPKPILGVEIPKSNGKTRLLGIPTVVDRWLQQAVSQALSSKFELCFEEFSYGFRPNKNTHKAVSQALRYINDGYQDIVDIDLKGFFDEVDHSILLQLIYNKIKCPYTLRLIRKWLRAPIQINGKMHKRRKGVPQGSPFSPLLYNILLDELDKELDRQGLPQTQSWLENNEDERALGRPNSKVQVNTIATERRRVRPKSTKLRTPNSRTAIMELMAAKLIARKNRGKKNTAPPVTL